MTESEQWKVFCNWSAMSKKSDAVKEGFREKKSKSPDKLFLSSGSTLINMAISGKVEGGWSQGCYYLLVGDSASGKTFLALQTLAEAANSPDFKDYLLLYDAPERGARMDLEKFFGGKLKSRIITAASETLESFYFRLDSHLKAGPCVYVLDSMDSLVPEDDLEKFSKDKAAHDKGKETSGSYGTAKAKVNSTHLRTAINKLDQHGSMLFIISQTRDNIGWNAQFNPKTRSGGTSLRFYATSELWFSIKERLKVSYKGKNIPSGSVLQVKVKKNRETGFEPTVELVHHPSHGFSDVDSLVGFLLEYKHWKETKGVIQVPEWGLEMDQEKLVRYIEEADLEEDLKKVVKEEWSRIEAAVSVQRKKRYV